MSFRTLRTPRLTERYTSDGYRPDRTITDYLDDVTARTPEQVALIDARRYTTHGELGRQVDRCVLGLPEDSDLAVEEASG